MEDLVIEYGPAVLSWLLVALAGALARYVIPHVKNVYVAGVLQRAWTEIQGAVMEVAQTFADAKKAARSDGKLTDDERMAARDLALSIAKENIGPKGPARLARILDLPLDTWLTGKTEQAVKALKAATVPPRPA